jgi:hypothetical protein
MTLGLEVLILASLPRLHNSPLAKCSCKKFCMDFHGDHTSTCTAHSGATKAHDWMVSVLGLLFRTVGHVVRTQLRISKYRACTLCLGTEAAGVPAGAAAPVTGAATDEYNLNVVDCNASVTVPRRSSISVSGGLGVNPAAKF